MAHGIDNVHDIMDKYYEMFRGKKQGNKGETSLSFIKNTLGPGVISFELSGMHEPECGSEAKTSF